MRKRHLRGQGADRLKRIRRFARERLFEGHRAREKNQSDAEDGLLRLARRMRRFVGGLETETVLLAESSWRKTKPSEPPSDDEDGARASIYDTRRPSSDPSTPSSEFGVSSLRVLIRPAGEVT